MYKLLRPEVVTRCIEDLRQRKAHEHMPGYLCLKRTSARAGQIVGLYPDFKAFYDTFMKVAGAPPQAPYLKIFLQGVPSRENLWFNRNVAGSYAPSSLRGVGPILKVATIGAGRGEFSLVEDHAKQAKRHLCFGDPIPALPLACFLYRDYGLQSEGADARTFVTAFQRDFGYDSEEGRAEFGELFEMPRTDVDVSAWLMEAK